VSWSKAGKVPADTEEDRTMTQYLLSVWHREGDATPSPDEMQQMFKDVDAVNKEMVETGAWVFGGGLEAPDTATVLKVDGLDVTMTDGPYAEAKEHIGGFWVIEAPDMDAALEWARKAGNACRNVVELRPFQAE
jgi:hypothetical protein